MIRILELGSCLGQLGSEIRIHCSKHRQRMSIRGATRAYVAGAVQGN